MRKIAILFIAPFVLFSTLSAQITQTEADEIVKERLGDAITSCLVYAQEELQTEGTTIATAVGETLELDYSCWVYYVDWGEETPGKYLIVKESNGNVLEINAKNDGGPEDLAEWRRIGVDIPFKVYSLSETLCMWTDLKGRQEVVHSINSNEELKQYIACAEEGFPEVDFSISTLLLVSGIGYKYHRKAVGNIVCKSLHHLSKNEYQLTIEVPFYIHLQLGSERELEERWTIAMITNKLDESSIITPNIEIVEASCEVENLSFMDYFLYVINSYEELEHFINCADITDLLEIDFSKHTLLLANASTTNRLSNINVQLIKTGDNTYLLDVSIAISGATENGRWIVKALIAKLPPDAVVSLNVSGDGWD